MLIKSPAFSVIAIVALALGIGANTAIFSVVEAVLLRPLPYPEPDKLILLREKMPIFDSGSVAYPNYLDWRAMQRSFTDLALYRPDSMNLSSRDETTSPERVEGGVMSWNMMRIVGLKPILGRDFTEAEDVSGGPKIALISEGLWRRRFGSSKKVLGQELTVDAVPRLIVGVLPKEMRGHASGRGLSPVRRPSGGKEYSAARQSSGVCRPRPPQTRGDAEAGTSRSRYHRT